MKYRPDIDGLRAVAVLSVLFFHAGAMVFSGGYVGVDVFFVISGYVIAQTLNEDFKGGTYSIWLLAISPCYRAFTAALLPASLQRPLFCPISISGRIQAISLPMRCHAPCSIPGRWQWRSNII